jgi:thymidylate synthase (FAD)
MKLIRPSFEILEQKPRAIVIPADMEIGPRMVREELLSSVYRQIEIAGRTCYKSEDKITDTSAKEFVERMVKSGHGAMLEHGTVYLLLNMASRQQYFKYCSNPYSVANSTGEAEKGTWLGFVTTNYRVLVENNWLDDLQYICEPGKEHEKRITVKFVCDRGVSHEFVRHRVFSFAQESTRYCNYSKDKFGNELTFIIPSWLYYEEQQFTDKNDSSCSIRTDLSEHEYFIDLLLEAERTYNFLVQYCGWKPQQARAVLPNSLKTELIMTGTIEQWKGFFVLRDAPSAHPQARELAEPLHAEFRKRGWCE